MQKLLALEGNDMYGLNLLIKEKWIPIIGGSIINFNLAHDGWCPKITEDGICSCNVEFSCKGFVTDD